MKSKAILIILSDLWGKEKLDWIAHYINYLNNYFEITYYDCCELGELNMSEYNEQNLHNQFINGGIEKAIANLNQREKREIHILAFSIGGYIGWKASLLELKTQSLFAISSTRLRMESEKPNCSIELFYGENDLHRPKSDWFKMVNIEEQLVKGENHTLYQKKEFAKWLTEIIIDKLMLNS